MNRPSRATVERLREMYPSGTRVKLIHMDDPYNQVLKPGCLAQWISWMNVGTLAMHWDCGSSLGVVYGEDEVQIVKKGGND